MSKTINNALTCYLSYSRNVQKKRDSKRRLVISCEQFHVTMRSAVPFSGFIPECCGHCTCARRHKNSECYVWRVLCSVCSIYHIHAKCKCVLFLLIQCLHAVYSATLTVMVTSKVILVLVLHLEEGVAEEPGCQWCALY